jgi:hypothetical protein
MGSGNSGFVPQDPAGYDEPDPTTGNRMQTDFAQQPEVKKSARYTAFHAWQEP